MKRAIAPAIAAVALACGGGFGWRALIPGGTRQSSGFANYDSAAVLTGELGPLHLFYDWTWFQRRNALQQASTANSGGYIPQTPLTMLPVIPFSWMSQQAAKQGWLALNLLFLAATIFLPLHITGFLPSCSGCLYFSTMSRCARTFCLASITCCCFCCSL